MSVERAVIHQRFSDRHDMLFRLIISLTVDMRIESTAGVEMSDRRMFSIREKWQRRAGSTAKLY